jgi:beta-alanine--pyruvate transaminase
VIPLGGVICRDHVYQAFIDANATAPDHAIEFMHGYTYSGHPVACAAAIATLNLYKEEQLFQRAGEMGRVLGDAMHSALKGLPNVIGIRTLGLAGAVELTGITGAPGKRVFDIFLDCYHQGVLVRPAADNIVLCPPYVVDKSHIEQMVGTLAASIKKHA